MESKPARQSATERQTMAYATLEGLLPRFLRLTGLNILANLAVPLASLIDAAMLGRSEGVYDLPGVALATPIFSYIFWSFGFLRMSTTGLTAQAQGTSDPTSIFHTLYRALGVAVFIGFSILVLQWPLRELGLLLLAGSAGAEDAARAYFDMRILGAPAALANFAFLGWFLGREQSGRAVLLTFVANIVNVSSNYVFIVIMKMGAQGAGIGTSLSQYAMLAVAVVLFLQQRQAAGTLQKQIVFTKQRMLALFRLNRDIMIRTFALVSAFALHTNVSSMLGDDVLAANAILIRLVEFAAYLIDGAAFATESLAGIARGAQSIRALRRVLGLAHKMGLALSLAFVVPYLVFEPTISGWMSDQPSVLHELHAHAIWLAPVLILGAPAFVYDGYYLGITEARALRNSMILSFLAFGIVATFAYIHKSNDLIWLALTAFMATRAVTLALLNRFNWKMFERMWPDEISASQGFR